MRDDSILEREIVAEPVTKVWRGRTATAIGALCSVVVLFAVVTWSYRLGVRDAAEIPVIRAEIEATKLRPGEPGGLVVDHQDRVVYGIVSGADKSGQTTLAAPTTGLAADDVAPVAVSPDPTPRPLPAPDAKVTIATPDTVEAPKPVQETAEPAPGPAPEADTTAAEAATTLPEDESFTEGAAPRFAPAAPPRPVRTVAASPAEVEPAAAEPRAAALASAVQIQLGAFESEAVAAEQWEAIKSRNGDLLAGRARVITPVLSGGRRLFRLRAGPFDTVQQASALCRGLIARSEACIVARAR